MENVVTILDVRLDEALKALKKLNKKAAKYGNSSINWSVSDARFETRTCSEGNKITVKVRDIAFDNVEAPKVGDYTFVAKLELTEHGTIIDSIPGETLPEHFRHSTGNCEHCQIDRFRKHLFVVRNPDGELVQVGRTCLRDYMGTDGPLNVAHRFGILREIKEFSDFWGISGVVKDSAEELLAVTFTAIRLWGWVPKSAPEGSGTPTAYKIGPWFDCNPKDTNSVHTRDQLKAAISEKDWEIARDTMQWIASEESGDNQYIHNLRLVLAPGVVPWNRRGLAISAVPSYQRYLGQLEIKKEEKEKTKNSRHVGSEKERLRDLQLTVTLVRGFDTQYGRTILYKFIDSEGCVFSWFNSGNSANINVNDVVILDATVKGHGEYNGVLETQLSRAKVKKVCEN